VFFSIFESSKFILILQGSNYKSNKIHELILFFLIDLSKNYRINLKTTVNRRTGTVRM
jgi:hypothetical protein